MKNFTKIAAAAALCISAAMPAAAAEYDFRYYNPEEEFALLGFAAADHYDVGIWISPAGLYDSKAKVTKIEGVVPVHDNIDSFKVWGSTELSDPGTARYFNGNLFNKTAEATPIGDTGYAMISATLDKAIDMPKEGIFVGISFDCGPLDGTNVTKYPIVVTEEDYGEQAMLYRGARNGHEWNAMAGLSLCITATFEGEFAEYSVTPSAEPMFLKTGNEGVYNITLTNNGTKAISSIGYTYTLGDLVEEGTMDVNIAGRIGTVGSIDLPLKGYDKAGIYNGKFTVTKINGNDNEAKAGSATIKLTVLDKMPVHRPVMEEFTGTWCGWCPRGMKAMELCREEFGDDFIGIAYHGRDVMELKNNAVPNPGGYPNCLIDRKGAGFDPYYGSSTNVTNEPAYILNDIRAAAAEFAPADVEVEAKWNEGNSALVITSTVNFAVIPDDGYNYRMGYVVVEDGLHGDDGNWLQLNYFAQYKQQYGSDPNLKEFCDGAQYLAGLQFNDVAIYATQPRGIADSLPRTNDLETGKDYTFTYEAPLKDFVSVMNAPSYQDLNNIRVIALLLKQENELGTISNAAQCKAPAFTAVSEVSADKTVVEYYTIDGVRHSELQNGINIVRYSDGTSAKVMHRN